MPHFSLFETIVLSLLMGLYVRPILEDRAKRSAEKFRQQREEAEELRKLDREMIRDRALQNKLNAAAEPFTKEDEERVKRLLEKSRQQRGEDEAPRKLDREMIRDRALQNKLNAAAEASTAQKN